MAVEWCEGTRTELDHLVALADGSPIQVPRYRELGRILSARGGPVVVGHRQFVAAEDERAAEITSSAVREHRHGDGLGRLLIKRAVTVARGERRSALLVATAAADTGVLRLDPRVGLRFRRRRPRCVHAPRPAIHRRCRRHRPQR